MPISSSGRRWRATASLATAATALALVSTGQSGSQAATPSEKPRAGRAAHATFDVRYPDSTTARVAAAKVDARAGKRAAVRSLRAKLGSTATIDIDGLTGTPRWIVDLGDGRLTGPSGKRPADIALGFVRDNLAAFGLEQSDMSSFRLRNSYRDIAGIRHVSFRQKFGGVAIFGFGLRASIDSRGRIVEIGGSPVPGALLTARPAAKLTGADAIARAKRVAGDAVTRATSDDRAEQVLVVTRDKTYLGWQTVTMASDVPALSVVDAATGRLLFHRPLGADDNDPERAAEPAAKPAPKSTGVAFEYFPGAPRGGSYHGVNFTKKGWLGPHATKLSGNNSHAYSDLDDSNNASKNEQVGPSAGQRWDYRLVPFDVPSVSFCGNPYPCSWDPETPFSWRTNRKQNTTQVFYFVNKFHDHLLKAPIGFTEDAGNFERVNSTKQGKAGDAVRTETMDGANTAGGVPDGAHLDNANMETPPDGMAPRMQMYLQHQPGTSYPDGDPFPANNTGDEGDTVYHEYTHGLSNRLVVDPTGNSGLLGQQAGSMGEAWSDFYAFDYLVAEGYQPDTATEGDVRLGIYDGAGQPLVRTSGLDCPVGGSSPDCDNPDVGHTGGYTYDDFADVIGFPEVHADGEIWAQTLWDLRNALGVRTTRMLVTRAMELSPVDPSYLDMRNAILVADGAVYGGEHLSDLWELFAARGMGYYAGTFGGNDASPAADFTTPPASVQMATVTGTVTDDADGSPVAGVPVSVAFQGGAGLVNPTAITAADGTYSMQVPTGDYGKITTGGQGYEYQETSISVTAGGPNVADFALRRDWAAEAGGGTIADFTGPDYSFFGCGPYEAIDLSQVTGWGSTTGDDFGTPTNTFVPKEIVVQLPAVVDASAIGVDPAATCGDGGSASLGDYRIETSANGSTWNIAAEGTFTVDDRGRINELTPASTTGNGIQYVRLTMLSNQTPDFATNCPLGAFSGCSYTDLSEITVYGAPTDPDARRPVGALGADRTRTAYWRPWRQLTAS
ncbi:M36 family metallopeptidase [Nocardioides sp.]|uniref:M36 family metallopeptidase n=1 Tax=Nocardioides sp. TaxID=35761 RepID=UPI00352849EF